MEHQIIFRGDCTWLALTFNDEKTVRLAPSSKAVQFTGFCDKFNTMIFDKDILYHARDGKSYEVEMTPHTGQWSAVEIVPGTYQARDVIPLCEIHNIVTVVEDDVAQKLREGRS